MALQRLFVVTILVVALTSGLVESEEPKVRIELTGAWIDVDPNLKALWARSLDTPDEYSQKMVSGGSSFGFSELKVLVPVRRIEIFGGYEREPSFEAAVTTESIFNPPSRWVATGSARVEAFDAGIAVPLSFGSRFELRPWGGVSYIRVQEQWSSDGWREWYIDATSNHLIDIDSSKELWGVTYGAEAVLSFTKWLALSARAFQRWGAGTWNEEWQDKYYEYPLPYEPGDAPVYSEVHNGTNSSKVTVMMFGLDLGLRATIARWIALESGWRYRDWSYDRGPGSYDGPYVRFALAF